MAEGVLRRGARDLAVRTRVLAAELGVGADGEVTVVLAGASGTRRRSRLRFASTWGVNYRVPS